ncbi:hypothetical protein C5F50_01690 [Nitrosopumilus ureiphilus]|uniref:Uncharacterized protein n=2 Tax=Nitrosopumilus ureiphilus TaxID=1470067 RepID=A0A7D5M3S2_9ARCH|nr:hypothetical protein C5F50_01690 [Nitrosopumilus ureiphilus]
MCDDTKNYLLEDWKMTMTKIHHLDDIILDIRTKGLPIGPIIQVIAIVTSAGFIQDSPSILGSNIQFLSLIMVIGSIYTVPIFLLDRLYTNLLIDSAEHAKKVEDKIKIISLSKSITTDGRSTIHKIASTAIYMIIIELGYSIFMIDLLDKGNQITDIGFLLVLLLPIIIIVIVEMVLEIKKTRTTSNN